MSRRLLAGATVAALALTGCATARPGSNGTPTAPGTGPQRTAAPATGAPATALPGGTDASAASAAPGAGPSTLVGSPDQSCAALAAQLTPAQQAGQVVLVGLAPDAAATVGPLLTKDALGGVWLTGAPKSGAAGVKALVDGLPAGPTPLLVAAVQQGGTRLALKGSGFSVIPPASAQGQLMSEELAARWTTWGAELKKTGVHLDLGPTGDVQLPVPGAFTSVPPDAMPAPAAPSQAPRPAQPSGASVAPGAPYPVVGDRSFSTDPSLAADAVAATVGGLQQAGVLAAPGRFPGEGYLNTEVKPNTSTTEDVTTASSASFLPFRAATASDAAALQLSPVTFRKLDAATPAALSASVVRLARDEIGFTGALVSPDLSDQAFAATPVAQRLTAFVTAGGDLALVSNPAHADAMVQGLAQAAANPETREKLAAAAANVLTLKARAGLVQCSAARG